MDQAKLVGGRNCHKPTMHIHDCILRNVHLLIGVVTVILNPFTRSCRAMTDVFSPCKNLGGSLKLRPAC